MKSAGIAKTELSVSAFLNATVLFASAQNLSNAKRTPSDESDLAPPLAPSTALYQQLSVLRI